MLLLAETETTRSHTHKKQTKEKQKKAKKEALMWLALYLKRVMVDKAQSTDKRKARRSRKHCELMDSFANISVIKQKDEKRKLKTCYSIALPKAFPSVDYVFSFSFPGV